MSNDDDIKRIVRDVYKRRSDAANRAAVAPADRIHQAKKPRSVLRFRPRLRSVK